jgi:type IV pilus assembly protein PilV
MMHVKINWSRSTGFTLLEVLVAVLVLAIGLLGMAGLQMTGMKSNNSAYLRSQASLLAYDITERMRANRNAALSGSYDDCGHEGGTPYTDCVDWEATIVNTLGNDGDTNCGTNTAVKEGVNRVGNNVTVCIEWDDSRGGIRDGDGTSSTGIATFVFTTGI